MHKTLGFFLCIVSAFCFSATSVFISDKNVAPEDAEKLGFHRLINGETGVWDDSWIIFVYPEASANGHRVEEVCLDIYERTEKLASSCVQITRSEIKGFNRSDIVVSRQRPLSVDVSLKYGNERYIVKNVVSLSAKDYESFKTRFNN